MSSSSTLQNRSLQAIDWARAAAKCVTMQIAREKRTQFLYFIVSYANLRHVYRHGRRGYLTSLVMIASTRWYCAVNRVGNLKTLRITFTNYFI